MVGSPATAAGLVTREVRSGSRSGRPTKIAVARRAYATDRADLWDALTDRERIPRWFLPISGDLEVGGRYQLDGNAGGVVEHCREPETFSITWEYGPMISWVTLTLTPGDGETILELRHEAPVDPAEAAAFPATPEGVAFVVAAADGWSRAAVADGDDPDAARAAAERSVAAYTASPQDDAEA